MKDNHAANRIAFLRDLLDLSQKEFSESIGISQGALSQLESGKTQLSFDTIRKLCQKYHVNCNWLIGENVKIFIPDGDTLEKMTVPHKKNHSPTFVEGLIPLVKEEVHAGYIKNCHDKDYITTLDVYKIPGYESGDYRLFEVKGDSMLPSIHPGEILVSEFVSDWKQIENGTLAIIVIEEGIVAKRVYRHDGEPRLILKSDNAAYKTYTVNIEEIKEIWAIKAKITSLFIDEYLSNAQKMKSMEEDIALLKNQMLKIQGIQQNKDEK